MMIQPANDEPLNHPDKDLLGMRDYPAKLAEFLRTVDPPFTVGIYGEWGSGKSSFVGILRHFLDQPGPSGTPPQEVKFIEFSAWPYRTSDELWRALVLTIARQLEETSDPGATESSPAASTPAVPESPAASATEKNGQVRWAWVRQAIRVPWSKIKGLSNQLRDSAGLRGSFSDLTTLLSGDAIALEGPSQANPGSRFAQVVAMLDETPYGTIGKTPQAGLRLDPEGTTVALIKAALAALGSISPLVAGLRGFLGLGGDIELSKLVARQNEAVRVRIESVQQFRKIFEDLFCDFQAKTEHGRRRRCLIFLDDLDRCMPDVALDILEAIKIFPDKAPCIFLVAADENLIGQGLRLRFKELLAGDGDGQVPLLLARKGQEYFEKIIQFAIRVPYRTEEQTHRLIAALFPQWIPATDLIRVAVDDNPRRLKQFSHWLSYRLLVAGMRGAATKRSEAVDHPDVYA